MRGSQAHGKWGLVEWGQGCQGLHRSSSGSHWPHQSSLCRELFELFLRFSSQAGYVSEAPWEVRCEETPASSDYPHKIWCLAQAGGEEVLVLSAHPLVTDI